MNEEVEIKVKLKDPSGIEEKILTIAKFVSEKKQIDKYFSPAHLDYFSEKPISNYLRIRIEQNKNKLCYHYAHFNKDGSLLKTDEYEVTVDDPEIAEQILEKTGHKLVVTVTKNRKVFETDIYEITIDDIAELGHFIEIESKQKVSDLSKTKTEMYALLNQLEIEYEPIPSAGYPDLIYQKDNP